MAARSLVIVESPAKARTIEKYLGKDFRVLASVGHVVDLPSSGLAVDPEDRFRLTYEVTKPDVIRSLKAAVKEADLLYLATDEDREGEAIAWHLREQLKPRVPVRRMVFHEITRKAISEAVERSREIDMGLVEAQEARRTLDRLYGYEVSPVLWRKVGPKLSAGRVQSPAIRLIVERERERMRFRSATWFDLAARHPTQPAFSSRLSAVEGRRVAQGKDFDEQGRLTGEARLLDEPTARRLADGLAGRPFAVTAVEPRPSRSSPKPPFITSTLQQEGGRKLRMGAKQVMSVAQGLYERGYITYMRTDSTTLSETAVQAARAQVAQLFGERFLPAAPRTYAKKAKNAQEAHEAIRPAGDAFRTPDELSGELNAMELKLYELIWKRTLASQMADAEGESLSLTLLATAAAGERCEFTASGKTILFPGYLRAYVEGTDDPEAALDDQESPLPRLAVGDEVPVEAVEPAAHATAAPARYTEASLVKKLEELGIGRPSTYASIIGALLARYVWKKGQALVPDWVSFVVVRLMEEHFEDLVSYAFTAEMEEDLDQVASGEREKLSFLEEFWFGGHGHPGLKKLVGELERIDAAAMNAVPIGDDPAGLPIVARVGRYGPYLRRGEDTAPIPDKLAPDELTVDKAVEILSAPKGGRPLGADPATGLTVYARSGRFGPYVQLGEVAEGEKPKTQSIPRTRDPQAIGLEEALQLLALPRLLGTAPDGQEVYLHYGKFGAYLRKGEESRNLGAEGDDLVFGMSLARALEVFAQPKQFRGRGQPRPPLATFGEDPVSGKRIVLKEGRFGHYVTDGETNASLRRGDDPGEVTPERAVELLAERREYLASPEGQARTAQRATRRTGRAARAAGKKAERPPGTPRATRATTAARGPAAPKASRAGKATRPARPSRKGTAPAAAAAPGKARARAPARKKKGAAL